MRNILLNNDNTITKKLEPLASLLEAQSCPYLTIGEIEILNWELREVKVIIEGINLNQGYVKDINIFNKECYPILFRYSQELNKSEFDWFDLNSTEKVKVYKWVTQLLLINLLTWCNKGILSLDQLKSIDPRTVLRIKQASAFLMVYRDWVMSFLDNCIKQHLRRNRVKYLDEIYAGFDTEYITKDLYKNELVSFQVSITRASKAIIPERRKFDFESIDTLTSKRYHRDAPKITKPSILREYIEKAIFWNQDEMFKGHWESINEIKKCLPQNMSVKSIYKDDEKVLIQGHQKPIRNLVFIAKEGEKLELNFDALTNIILKYAAIGREGENLIKSVLKGEGGLERSWFWQDLLKGKGPCQDLLKEGKREDPWNAKTMKSLEPEFIVWSNEENNSSFPVDKTYKNEKINYGRRIYLLAHYNAADLTMIKDWKTVSYKNIDILKKGYASLVRPIKSLGESVFIRDTLALSSAAAGTLEAVGKAHGLKKVEIDAKWYVQMDKFLQEKRLEFIKYAAQDSLITLIHGLFMNDFAFNLGSYKLPITLGALSTKYVELKWKEDGYKGYQVNHEFPIGDAQTTHTPQGITALGRTGDYLNGYLGSFRGGRNECFAYGIDKDTRWFDYDLTSCYSTIMSMLGDPDYKAEESLVQEVKIHEEFSTIAKGSQQENSSLYNNPISANMGAQKNKYSAEPSPPSPSIKDFFDAQHSPSSPLDVLGLCGEPDYAHQSSINNSNVHNFDYKNGYSALRVVFKFPSLIKFPPIPVSLDKNITIYPLSGESLITGLEYQSALNILSLACSNFNPDDDSGLYGNIINSNYYINIISGSYIPFKKQKPFYNIINDLQRNRKLHPKKSAMERIYKDLGNMLYGKVVCGISNKRKFDSRIMVMKAMTGSYLSNPIIGSWITGFVRALLAELLFANDYLGGKVTAVTTDGFVSNIPDLENQVLNLFKSWNFDTSFLQSYRDIRMKLSNNPEALEVKTNVRGIIQWTTRGQLSVDSSETGVPIAAMTGFQKYHFSQEDNIKSVTDALNSRNKILFLQKRLSGSLDFVKSARQVSMVDSLRQFRTVFDSKRLIVPSKDTLLSTLPYRNPSDALLYRGLLNQLRQSIYNQGYSYNSFNRSNIVHETIKLFIRSVCSVFNFNTDLIQKNFIVNVITEVVQNDIKLKIKLDDKYIYKLIAFIELNPGVVKNTITIMRNNNIFVWHLFKCLQNNYINYEHIRPIIKALNKTFSNFFITR